MSAVRELSMVRIPPGKLNPALDAITISLRLNNVPISPPITRSLSPSP